MAYCTVDDVKHLTQPKPPYSGSTVPTIAQVTAIIDFIDGEINVALSTGGYTLPITDSNALLYLKATSIYGSASLSEQALQQQGNPEVSEHVADYWEKYSTRLMAIQSGKIRLSVSESTSGRMRSLQTSHAVDGSEDGISDLTPWVRRDTDF